VEQPLGSKYLLHEMLGRGAMGQVFRGTVRATGAPVAVKILKPELVSDTEVVARFFRERSILTSIDHPNVAGVLDLVVEGDTLGIVMELVPGQDLRRYLRSRGTLPPAEAVRLTCQLLQGLTAVHAAGIVHRDVKPENVLVSTPGRQAELKLTDFGVSRLSYGASLTKMTSLIGTPEYMAPELADHDSATPAADLYSTGIVLYEMLAGRTPFAGGHPLAVLRRHVEQLPPPIAGVPADLWAQIDSMLAKDPRSRPGSAAAALGRLAPLQAPLAGRPALPPVPDGAQDRVPGAQAYPSARDSRITQPPVRPGQESDQTVFRPRRRGPEPAFQTGPAQDVAGRGEPGRRQARSRPWTRRRAAVVALPAALVILGAAVAVLLTRSPHSAPPAAASAPQATASYSFSPAQYQDGLLIVRRWTLGGKEGSLLTETITASSATGKPVRVKFEEPIPAAIASTMQSVRFAPAPSRVIQADPVVQWDLSVPARGTIAFGYQATVSPDGVIQGRLTQWVKDFDAMQVTLGLPQPITVGVRSLSITPSSLNLTEGGSASLALRGLLGSGRAAPKSLLAGAAWTTSNQDVATVDAVGTVVAFRAGTAVITAQLGTARASATVTVAGTSNFALGGNNPPAPGGGSAGGQQPGAQPGSHASTSPADDQSPTNAQSSPVDSPSPSPSPSPSQTSAAPNSPAPAPATSSPPPVQQAPTTYAETTGGVTHTWTDYSDAGGTEGPTISSNATVQIACKVTGFKVADGNTWWYRIASSPWNNAYYASADAFYNNGQTSGSLSGTPFVDTKVPDC
jgi:hypothetical protein